jgi:hypothetical protein
MGSSISDLDPTERALRARLAAYEKHAKTDGREATAAARAASPSSDEYWLAKVDPDRRLSRRERIKRARAGKRAHFTRMALRSKKARAKRKESS